MAREVTVGPIAAQLRDGTNRVAADVDGESVWYESADIALDDGPEGLAGAMLLPAVVAGRRLQVTDPVSRQWLDNIGSVLELWRQWWNYPAVLPDAPLLAEARPRCRGTALCFTGGVDSFHTLLCGSMKVELLAFVHGYDVPLGDSAGMATWEPALRAIAAAVDTPAVLLRSNLREHRLFARTEYAMSHGGAVAAIGHLLVGRVGTLLLSAGAPDSYGGRWGSHFQLDPLWSSDHLEVVHCGGEHSRLAKVRELADHALARQHLRVCLSDEAAGGNCSRCDKCVSTMALIAGCGAAGQFESFDWRGSLAARLDGVPRTLYVRTYRELLTCGLDSSLAAAVEALLERTPKKPALRRRVRWLAGGLMRRARVRLP